MVLTIRTSALNNYSDCPRRSATILFREIVRGAGYVLRDLPSGVGAAIGSAVHRAAAVMLAEKARTGELGPSSVAADAATDLFRATVREGVMWDEMTPHIETGLRQVARMAFAYRRDIAPDVQPLIVEEQLEAAVTSQLNLTGHPDVVAREPGRVRDLKTGRQRANLKPQLGGYSLLARSNGLDVHECAEDFIKRVGAKTTQPPAETHLHDVGAAETAAVNVLRHIATDLRVFQEGDNRTRRVLPGDPWAFLANPNSKLCGDKLCRAHGTEFCREWRDA